MKKKLSQDEQKKLAAEAAVDSIQSGMIIGLGTGSTVRYAIKKLGQRVKEGLAIQAISTSLESAKLAQNMAIPLTDFSEQTRIDLTIDGADEVDAELNLIKGGGGALLREKIVAATSQQVIIAVDESKLVEHLGVFPLPVEIVPFAWQVTKKALETFCPNVVIRQKQNKLFLTDNGNYILDCHFGCIEKPAAIAEDLKKIIGVIETGLFVNLATTVIIGQVDGTVRFLSS